MNIPYLIDHRSARPRNAGWSFGWVGTGTTWLVTGSKGARTIQTEGDTLAEALEKAWGQAREVLRAELPRKERRIGRKSPLTIPLILAWADDHHETHGAWPKSYSGPVRLDLNTNWRSVDNALRNDPCSMVCRCFRCSWSWRYFHASTMVDARC
jgi:hypothetical protein